MDWAPCWIDDEDDRHPPAADLDRLITGELPAPEVRALIVHLLGGCEPCRQAVETRVPFLADVWLEEGDPSAQLTPAEEAAYDRSLDRAIGGLLQHGEQVLARTALRKKFLVRLRRGADPNQILPAAGQRLALLDALLARAWELRADSPEQMVQLARQACRIARELGLEGYGAQQVADHAARASGELGNALRIAERLDDAEATFRHALDTWALGTRDAGLRARLLDLTASLLGARGRNGEAVAILAHVHDLYMRLGDQYHAGRALLGKSTYTGLGGRPEEALELLHDALALLGEGCDPGLRLIALHNQILFTADSGRYAAARELLARDRQDLRRLGSRLQRVKLAWIEGRVDAGLGALAAAERALRQARRGFGAAGLEVGAARVEVDLAAVLLRRGRASEARALAVKAAETFLAQGIEGEGLAAVLTLREAFELEIASAVLVERIASFLRRLEHDPSARFESRARGRAGA